MSGFPDDTRRPTLALGCYRPSHCAGRPYWRIPLVLYLVLRASILDGDQLMEDAQQEHREAKGLLAELEDMEVGSLATDSKVATLRRAIDHHVQEEEGEVFPMMESSLNKSRLEDLGVELEKAERSAAVRPPTSAAQDSPGSSIAGTVTAAADRLRK
jgi:hypothetical protein